MPTASGGGCRAEHDGGWGTMTTITTPSTYHPRKCNFRGARCAATPPQRGTLFRNGNKITRCGAEICRKMQKKMPKIKERLFSAFLCGHYSGISGLVSTKTMPDLNVPLDSAGIGPQTRIDGDIQGES